jgi:hypothetical protein
MKELWEFVIEDSMQVSEVSACNFLMIDNPINTKENKQKLAEIVFDDMKVSIFLKQQVLGQDY